MTAYQIWLTAALVGFCAGPLGISFWLACSWLAVLRRKRLRVSLGAAVFAILFLSGWIPARALQERIRSDPQTPMTPGEILLLAYLHASFVAGVAIILIGRQRAPRSPIPPTHEEDLGMGSRLLALHRQRHPWSPWPRLPFNQVYGVKLRDWEIPVTLDGAPLPEALKGFTILHLSDPHLGSYLLQEYTEALGEKVAGIHRDALVFTGDFLDRQGRPEDLGPWLAGILRPGEAAFAVLGNHDMYDHKAEEVLEAIASAGVHHLGTGSPPVLVRRRGAAVAFAGLDYQNWWKRFPVREARAGIPGGALPVLLTHTPCPFPRAREAGFALVLCGHTHGGQIRVPVLGAPFIPARYGRRYQMGLYKEGASHLHVHPGLGGPPPLRIGCPPEVTRLILK